MDAPPNQPWIPRFFVRSDGGGTAPTSEGDFLFLLSDARHLAWRRMGKEPRDVSIRVRDWDPRIDSTQTRELTPGEIERLIESAPAGVHLPPYSLKPFSPSATDAIASALGHALANGRNEIHMEHLLAGLGRKSDGALRRLAGERFEELLDVLESKFEARLRSGELVDVHVVPRLSLHVFDAFLEAARIANETNNGYVQHHILLQGARSVAACDAVQVLEQLVGGEAPPSPHSTSSDVAPFMGVRFAEHLSDRDTGADRLDIKPYVEALAALLINEHVAPPLSVGLFGDWGAGKSFFISKLKAAVERFSKDAQADLDLPFCKGCVQIEFNAWQYADADLWAGLVVHILDELALGLSTETDAEAVRKQLVEGLATVETRRKQLEKEVAAARRKVGEARQDVLRASRERRRSEAFLAAAESLGVVKKEQRAALARDLQSSGGYLGRSVRGALTNPWVFALLAASIAFVAFGGAGRLVKLLSAAPVVLLAGFKVLTAYSALRQAGKEGMPNEATVAEKDRIEQLEEDEQAKQEELETARKEELQLEAKLAALDPKAALLEVLGRRPAYEESLGLISQIHRDFRELDTLIERVKKASSKKDQPKIERIILYIDDLDRCDPKRVVEVLQAVHLLLAFKLFVVVVAVDPRWLRRALEVHYPELLLNAENAQTAGDLATPRDYLEKIFQVPFVLPPLAPEKSREFLESLLAENSTGVGSTANANAPDPSAAEAAARAEPDRGAERAPSAEPLSPGSGSIEQSASVEAVAPAAHEPEGIEARRVRLSDEEKDFMTLMGGFFSTPRAAKRFVNSYRLLRTTVDVDALTDFVGTDDEPGSYRGAVLMTAVAVGFPGLLPHFRSVKGDGRVQEFIADFGRSQWLGSKGPRSESRLQGVKEEEVKKLDELLEPERLADVPLAHCRRWASAAERFTFQA